MRRLHAFWHRLQALFRRRQLESDLDEELRFHLTMSESDRVDAGAMQSGARTLTLRHFGSVTAIKEQMREAWAFAWVEHRLQDIAFALRMLRKTPTLAVVAVTTLALGIGATTAVFSLFEQTLLRPLPVPEPDRLVNFSAPGPKDGESSSTMSGPTDDLFSYPMFRDIERAQTAFTSLGAHRIFDGNLSSGGRTLHAKGLLVSGGYFPALNVAPRLGRLLGPEDERAFNESHVVVLGYDYWRSRLASDPSVINRTLIVNGQTMTIVGVAPEGFSGTTLGRDPQVFVPLTMATLLDSGVSMQSGSARWTDRRTYWLYVFGRLKPDVTLAQARLALNGPYHNIINDVEAPLNSSLYPDEFARFKAKTLVLTPGRRGQSETPARARPALVLLLGATACVLLIACANIANLLLARAAARESEMAARLAFGASSVRLVGQLLTESAVLAIAGGAGGMFVARLTMAIVAPMLPSINNVSLRVDGTLLMFTAGLVLATSLVFGLFPALHCIRADLSSAIRAQGSSSGGRSAARFRSSLAIAQIALSLTLLVAAGLFLKSLSNISRISLGFTPDHIVSFGLSPQLNGYRPGQSQRLVDALESRLADTPGVAGVTDSMVRLLTSNNWGNTLEVEGFTSGPDINANALVNEVGPAYFSALGIRLLAGREIDTSDMPGTPKVAVVNQAFAKKFHLGGNPVGKRIGLSGGRLDTEIVGLVQDAKYSEVKDEIPAQYFTSNRQWGHVGVINIYVRTELDPTAVLKLIPQMVASLDPDLPVEDLRTLPDQVRENIAADRLIGTLSTAFAALATLLAAIGLYGVLAYTVSQRAREIGLRVALGATPRQVRTMMLRQVASMTAVGSAIGLIATLWFGRAAQALLYGLQGGNPSVLVAALGTLGLVALLAGWIPAWRASRIEPAEVLRQI